MTWLKVTHTNGDTILLNPKMITARLQVKEGNYLLARDASGNNWQMPHASLEDLLESVGIEDLTECAHQLQAQAPTPVVDPVS